MASISNIKSREILDSRGNPTVEADVILTDGSVGTAAVPSGASTGRFEAHELRDNDLARYKGKGVLNAVRNIEESILPAVKGVEVRNQTNLDRILVELDGTPNKSSLGANTLLAVSLASSKAAAISRGYPLYKHIASDDKFVIPVPMLNIINGGRHAEHSTDIQEFMVVPAGFDSFAEALRAGTEVYHQLRNQIASLKLGTTVGDEGGFAPSLSSNQVAIDLIIESIESSGYKLTEQFFLAIDVAASEMFDGSIKKYGLEIEGRSLNGEELTDLYGKWVDSYPIISIEDGLSEDEWEDWQSMTSRLGSRVQLVGDDLLTTNPDRISRAVREQCGNAVLIKPNQIGTLSETMEAIDVAKPESWGIVMSHRSGETEDTSIADLAVGTRSEQIKTGAPARGERTAKYNRLIRIEQELGANCDYAGMSVYTKYLKANHQTD